MNALKLPGSSPPASALTAWIDAFNRNDVVAISDLYAKDAVLWGTTASALIASPAGIKTYFAQTFARAAAIRVTLGDFVSQYQGDDLVIHSGIYTLLIPHPDAQVSLAGRFTFISRRVDSGWIIINHHSSVVPAADVLLAHR